MRNEEAPLLSWKYKENFIIFELSELAKNKWFDCYKTDHCFLQVVTVTFMYDLLGNKILVSMRVLY